MKVKIEKNSHVLPKKILTNCLKISWGHVIQICLFLAIAHLCASSASLIPNENTQTNLYSTSQSNILIDLNQSAESLRKAVIIAKCTKDAISLYGYFPNEFKGRIYAANYPDEPDCGTNKSVEPTNNFTFTLPTGECGIMMTNLDENGENNLRYEVVLYIQHSAFLQQAHDEKVPVFCVTRKQPEEDQLENLESEKIQSNTNTLENNTTSSRQGRRMKHAGRDLSSVKAPTKIAEAIMEIINGKDPSPKTKKVHPVSVGEDVTLVITTKVLRGYDARIVNCTTHDGSRSSATDGSRIQPILDSAGCSVDKGLVPNFRRRRLPVESRNRIITLHFASFPAFKFPERDHLHIKCSVAYCKGPCPQEACDSGINHFGSWRDKYGRISDALVETSPVVNAIEVLSPELEAPGGHHYERHQSNALGLSVPLGGPSSSAAGGQQHLGLESNSNQQGDERSSSSSSSYNSDNSQEQELTNHYSSIGSGGQSMSRPGPYHTFNNNNNLPSPSSIYGNNNNNGSPLPNSSNNNNNNTNVCISPGTVILALVILGVVLVISITATLWFALKRSEAKKYAQKTSLAFSSPGPAPYYRFNHW